ncbi:SdpA family antimicrobial peptide system protein [Staphylococcus felis]|uniref:SdpA family antimicrobial peptide system protein n=1 Tax=Staphylococcus felis TaxID=46127 RepID=UPI00248119DC|nr:SdpA family antimicrobial peptide system protein [Staphylococcus felis]MDQ7193759.1 SdpA family antimicrobial peptide system protein [Staphylococcus felis]
MNLPNFQSENLWGLKRTGRAQAIELGRLDAQIKKNQWYTVKHEKEIPEKVNSIKNPYSAKKDNKFKNIKPGEYIIIKKEPISWYFREFKETTSQNIKITKVVIYD